MSWDHLSSKAPLHIAPDMTLVWNDVQKREAVDMDTWLDALGATLAGEAQRSQRTRQALERLLTD